jgi:hypothetical protein
MALGFAVLFSVPILLLLVLAGRRVIQKPSVSVGLSALGAMCLLVMLFARVEGAGRALNQTSTTLGIAFLVAASLCPLLSRRERA